MKKAEVDGEEDKRTVVEVEKIKRNWRRRTGKCYRREETSRGCWLSVCPP